MTWSYLGAPGTGDATARRDAVRFLIKDTDSSRQLVQDEEIDFLLSQNANNVWGAAADTCDKLAAREAQSKSVGDLSITGFGTMYRDLGYSYRMRLGSQLVPFAGGISVADKDARDQDTDRTPASFTRALHRNPETDDRAST